MPIPPRIYAIPRMASYRDSEAVVIPEPIYRDNPPAPIEWDSPELQAKLADLRAAIDASKAKRAASIEASYDAYLDSLEPGYYDD